MSYLEKCGERFSCIFTSFWSLESFLVMNNTSMIQERMMAKLWVVAGSSRCSIFSVMINAAHFLVCLQLLRDDALVRSWVRHCGAEEERIKFLWRNTRDYRAWVMQQENAECETQEKLPTSCDCHDPSAPRWENFLRFVICILFGRRHKNYYSSSRTHFFYSLRAPTD